MKNIILTLLIISLTGCAVAIKPNSSQQNAFELHKFEQSFGYTQAIKVENRIYISGTVSMDAYGNTVGKGDMRSQVKQSYEVIKKTLAHYGADFSHIVKETIHTTDMDAFLKVTDERAKFYKGMRFPVSSWIGVNRLVSPDYLFEVEVEAVLPQ